MMDHLRLIPDNMDAPNPMLNAEERRLVDGAPQESLRRAVARGALQLDSLVAHLPPRIAAAVAALAAGERPSLPPPSQPPAPPEDTMPVRGLILLPGDKRRPPVPTVKRQAPPWTPENARSALQGPYPQLAQVLDAGMMSPDEAIEAAHAIDGALGRYATGTRYAAP
jgi:hypothetical protein